MTNKPYVPPQRLVGETDMAYQVRSMTDFRLYLTKRERDNRRRYDKEGNLIPAKTGAQRQKRYEWCQNQGGKKRPGWWLSEEVIKAITARRWKYDTGRLCDSKSDKIDAVLRYLLRIVEVVETKAKETGRMPEREAIELVLEKIAAIEVPYIPPLTEEERRKQYLVGHQSSIDG